MSTFKAGDDVYFPQATRGIVTLKSAGDLYHPYSLMIEIGDRTEFFTECGRIHKEDVHPVIFHATNDMCEKLQAFYRRTFMDPYIPNPKAIIQALLNKTGKPVRCLVARYKSTIENGKAEYVAYITSVNPLAACKLPYHDTTGMPWEYAMPIDDEGNMITKIPT